MKVEENEKKDKYLDIARELKRLWNMKVTVIPIVVGALGTFTKSVEKETVRTRDQSKNWNHWDYNT